MVSGNRETVLVFRKIRGLRPTFFLQEINENLGEHTENNLSQGNLGVGPIEGPLFLSPVLHC